MWPTENTILLLFIGLLPLLFVVAQCKKYGFKSFLGLKFIGVIFIWIGYQLSPWIGYFKAERWDVFLLVEEYIDQGIIFSTMCMFVYVFGFSVRFRGRGDNDFVRLNTNIRVPKIKIGYLIIFAVSSFMAFVITSGGLVEIWRSSLPRGAGQFLERDAVGKVFQMINVISVVLHSILACASSLFIIQSRKSPFFQIVGWCCLLISSLSSISFFSRAAGYSFVIFSFICLKINGLRAIPNALLALFVAVYLGSVGLNERNNFHPGLGNFIDAVSLPNVIKGQSDVDSAPSLLANPFDALAPWTRKARVAETEFSSILTMGPRFFWNLHPFPSEIVPLLPLGRDLAEIMGVYGHFGITTPALAELFYAFGHFGCLLLFPLGMLYSWIEKTQERNPNFVALISNILCFISFPIGLHSSMRAMTRPLVYAIFLLLLAKYIKSIKRNLFANDLSGKPRSSNKLAASNNRYGSLK